MAKSYYILCVLLCSMFVTSCQTVESESEQTEEPVVKRQGEPYYKWGVQQSLWPYQYPTYWYMWSAENALEQATIIGLYEAESEQLKNSIVRLEIQVEKLEREKQALTVKLEEQIDWSDFWKRLTKILMKGLYDVEERRVENGCKDELLTNNLRCKYFLLEFRDQIELRVKPSMCIIS